MSELRFNKCEFRVNKKDNNNIVEGYAAVFNSLSVDLGGFREIILPGSFQNSLNNDVRGLVDHDSSMILGRTTAGTLQIEEDDIGLKTTINMPHTTHANNILESINRGDVSGMSFGFRNFDGVLTEDKETGFTIQTISDIPSLFDVSIVTFPAYPQTEI